MTTKIPTGRSPRSPHDLRQWAHNRVRQAGQCGLEVWRAPSSGPRWAIVVAWVCVVVSALFAITALIFHVILPIITGLISIMFGLDYLRGQGWWK
jgi:hypothetical protein